MNEQIRDGIKEENSRLLDLLQLPSYRDSIRLVRQTRENDIYYFPSPLGKIALKVLRKEFPLHKDLQKNNNELAVSKLISHPVFRKSIVKTTYENKQALLLKWAEGNPISQFSKFEVRKFLVIGREIVSTIVAMHSSHVMHMSLSCEHIIYDPSSNSVKIIGSSSSSSFSSERSYVSRLDNVDIGVDCISPEQANRDNRLIDFRSDFYSLGVIFYRILTGKFPFENRDKLQILKMHVSHKCLPIHIIDQTIAIPISCMVSKLMEKNPEKRYQSAKGILHDLDLIISEYETDKNLTSVTLGTYEVPVILLLPHKLYGCESEYTSMLSAATRSKSGSFEIIFLSGRSGTGKTSIAMELYESMAQDKGFFLYGKYDFSISKPYSALIEAMRNFCEMIILQDEETFSTYKSKIKLAVGEEGKLLTDIISNLHLIIGSQPPVAHVSGQDGKNRFIYVLIKFMKAICLIGRPITLILDDLQWVDAYSLNIFSLLMNESFNYLLIVGIYREDEVSREHPLAVILKNVKSMKNPKITKVKLKNFNYKAMIALISDTLHISQRESYAIATLVYEKTKGNPLFVKKFLSSLYEEKIVYFNSDKRKWDWDERLFDKNKFLDDILEFYRRKLLSFDELVQEVFKVASCLGNKFSLSILYTITNRIAPIKTAVSTGLIIKSEGSETIYRFAHDEIQQVASSLIPSSKKQTIFMYIGTKLWKLLSDKERDENIFVIVNLINPSLDKVICKNERTKISELYLIAGEKCLASTAYKDAYKYFKTGVTLLSSNCWEVNYSLSLRLHNAAAESAYCIDEYDYMRKLLNIITIKAVSFLDKEFSYLLSVQCYNKQRMFDEGFNEGLRILENIGYNLCPNQYEEDFQNTKSLIRGKLTKAYVDEMKIMSAEIPHVAVTILYELLVTCYFARTLMTSIVALRIVQLTFSFGATEYSAFGFVFFGNSILMKDYRDALGYECAEFAQLLLKKIPAKEVNLKVLFGIQLFFNPRIKHVQQSLEPFLKISRKFLEIGSIGNSIICVGVYVLHAFHSGKSLEKLERELKSFNEELPKKPMSFSTVNQAVLNLLDVACENPAILIRTDCKFINQMNPGEIVGSLIQCIFVSYLFQDYSTASSFIEKCRPLLKKIMIRVYIYSIHVLYDGLVALMMSKKKRRR